jgi:dihydrofolate reductase
MGKLAYMAIASLDGYVAGEDGRWNWSIPSEEVHASVNELSRTWGTWLLGRRMYDVLVAWETMEDDEPVIRDFTEIWHGSDKVVYSRSLEEVRSKRTRIEREFDPDAVRRLKQESAGDLSVAGPGLAAQALQAGLVDDIHLYLSPIVIGGGNPALPSGLEIPLELAGERRFANGVVHLHYRVG